MLDELLLGGEIQETSKKNVLKAIAAQDLLQEVTFMAYLLSYSVFQGFSKAKSANGGSILSLSQFLILPQLPQEIKLASKVVKVDSKIIIS
jgi:hypothetical protein